MLFLTATNQSIDIVTSTTEPLDVLVAAVDLTATATDMVTQDTKITTATTTVVVGAPGASTHRQIKTLMIRNVGAGSQTVTVRKTVAATSYTMRVVSLAAGESLEYVDTVGWFVLNPLGMIKGDHVGGASGTHLSLQYNANGILAGSTMTEMQDDHLTLVAESGNQSSPSLPSSDRAKFFARKVAGRVIPSFVGPSGQDTTIQPSFARNKIATLMAAGSGTVITNDGMPAPNGTGTATTAAVALTNLHTSMKRIDYLVTTAATTAIAGLRVASNQYARGSVAKIGGFFLVWRFGIATGTSNATQRLFVGLYGTTGALTDVEPSSRLNMIGVGRDAADTNLQMMFNDGAGTAAKIDLGALFPKPTVDRANVYELALFAPVNSLTVKWQFTNLDTDDYVEGSQALKLPAANQLMCPQAGVSAGGTSAVVGFTHMGLYIETDF